MLRHRQVRSGHYSCYGYRYLFSDLEGIRPMSLRNFLSSERCAPFSKDSCAWPQWSLQTVRCVQGPLCVKVSGATHIFSPHACTICVSSPPAMSAYSFSNDCRAHVTCMRARQLGYPKNRKLLFTQSTATKS